jgi:hypothetical protein
MSERSDLEHNMRVLGTDEAGVQALVDNLREQGVIADQPPPLLSDGPPIVDLVVADLEERKRVGIERYGMPLRAHNGRDPFVDAYQEALDLVVYLRQVLRERPTTDANCPHCSLPVDPAPVVDVTPDPLLGCIER